MNPVTNEHRITRDLPNWFWCGFEHADTEQTAELASRGSATGRAA
jgi:hypothetical protein